MVQCCYAMGIGQQGCRQSSFSVCAPSPPVKCAGCMDLLHDGGEFPRPRHSAHDHSVCASCSALCRGRYAPNLNYTRLGSEPPQPRGRARRWTANGQARLSTQLLRRPTVRLSSRRSPMPQRVAPIVGAWGAAGTDSVSTPIDRSAARRARPGWVYFTWGASFHVPGTAHTSTLSAQAVLRCAGDVMPRT
jgi:hypothetical protein